MDVTTATRGAKGVGLITTVIGGALAAAPATPARALRLDGPAGLRVIGIADLALAPGLLAGRPRWPWMAGRVGLNLAIAAYCERSAREGAEAGVLRATALALLAVSTMDARMARVLFHARA